MCLAITDVHRNRCFLHVERWKVGRRLVASQTFMPRVEFIKSLKRRRRRSVTAHSSKGNSKHWRYIFSHFFTTKRDAAGGDGEKRWTSNTVKEIFCEILQYVGYLLLYR